MSIRTKCFSWTFIIAFLVATPTFHFALSKHPPFELSGIATDIAWGTFIAAIAGAWGFRYAKKIANAATAVKAFGWGCLVACLTVLTIDAFFLLIHFLVSNSSTPAPEHDFISTFVGFLIMLLAIIFVSFFVASIGIIIAGFAGWLFWRRYR